MTERHEKWQRVEPGTVIPAGQPYRIEWSYQRTLPDSVLASERVCDDHDVKAFSGTKWFVDSSWKPPLVLPTEPTWGIAVMQDNGPMVGNWRTAYYVPTDFQCDDHGTYQTSEVADFIECTPEQVARLEAAR